MQVQQCPDKQCQSSQTSAYNSTGTNKRSIKSHSLFFRIVFSTSFSRLDATKDSSKSPSSNSKCYTLISISFWAFKTHIYWSISLKCTLNQEFKKEPYNDATVISWDTLMCISVTSYVSSVCVAYNAFILLFLCSSRLHATGNNQENFSNLWYIFTEIYSMAH